MVVLAAVMVGGLLAAARPLVVRGGVAAEPTPNCPGGSGDAPCLVGEIRGNTYVDRNGNGRYDPGTGDSRAPGLSVRLLDAASGALLGESVTSATGFFSFPGLNLASVYVVEGVLPPGYRPSTAVMVEVQPRDFSTYWCCTARVDFGVIPGEPPTATPFPTLTPVVPNTPEPPTAEPLPPLPPPTIPPPPCVEIPPGRQIHLPILHDIGSENTCASVVEVQNVGAWPSKAILLVWGSPSACPPQCAGPLKVECSGLLAPGAAWHFLDAQLPRRARSGMVFSAPPWSVATGPAGSDVFADVLCETLLHEVVGNCDNYRRFKKAYNELGVWTTSRLAFDFGLYLGAALSAEVVRKCPGDANPLVFVTSSYVGFADEHLGFRDPVFGDYTYYAPLVSGGASAGHSVLYVQNGGLECTSVEVWFQEQGECLRRKICDVLTLAPGETASYDATACVPDTWIGSAWLRGVWPLSVVVDQRGQDLLATYGGAPGDLGSTTAGVPGFSAGSRVLFGPLLYSEYQGWEASVQVQNLSRASNAQIKVTFLDRSGNVVATLTDWLCPGGSQGLRLPLLATMPGNWVGSIRVESTDLFVRGGSHAPGPNIAGVVTLKKYADLAATVPLEEVAYSLVPEQRAFDWQTGSGPGGLASGVGRIAIPSLLKDRAGLGLTTELAIANVVPAPGYTDLAILIYDQNGLVDVICQKLGQLSVEYVNLASDVAILPAGFRGSAVISAVHWQHPLFADDGRFLRNLVGLAAVKIERSGTVMGADAPGDESAGSEGLAMLGRFAYLGGPIRPPGMGAPEPPMVPSPAPPVPTAPAATGAPPPGTTPTPGIPVPPGPPTP